MTTTVEPPVRRRPAVLGTAPMHCLIIETRNPHARALLSAWASAAARATWDLDPATGRQYVTRIDAFVTGGRAADDRVDVVPLDRPADLGAPGLTGAVEAHLDTLAGRLADAAADARAGDATALDVIEAIAGDLARLAGQPAPAARGRRD